MKRYSILRGPAAVSFLQLSIVIASYSTNYPVGPDKPHKKPQDVAALLKAGDTVFVDGNATYQGGVVFTAAGTKASPIVVKGVRINGKRPCISGGVNTVHFSSDWPYDKGADNYVFEGFEITGGSSRGIYHQADNLSVRDVAVHDCPQQGILGADQGSGSCLLEQVEVYNCGDGDRRHQIYMSTDQVHHPGGIFRMQHCYIHDAKGGNNVKSRAERNEIYYNWIEGAFYHELELIGPDPGGVADEWTPHLKREDSDVVGNVLMKRRTAANNDENFPVTRIGGDATGETHGRYRFVNNTIICGTGAVFRMFDSLESVEMHNNIFFRAGGGVNIMRTVDASWVHGTAIMAGTRNWVYQGASNIPAQWTGTITGTDPGFSGFSQNDLRPANGSPLVNAGSPSVQSAAGYDFPGPLFPPRFRPPIKSVDSLPAARHVEGTIDVGAFELEAHPVQTAVVNSKMPVSISIRPNPCVATLDVGYRLARGSPTVIELAGADGRRITTLYAGVRNGGHYTVTWDCRDDGGNRVPPGIYICRVKTDASVMSRAVMLTK